MRFALLLCVLLSFQFPAFAVKDGSEIQADELYPRVKLETSMGDIEVELDRKRAPITVNNFLRYVNRGSYDNTIFHRIVPNFVVQGGGYDAEFNAQPAFPPIFNESGNGLKNDLYTIAMARQDSPHSANRQFFFNAKDNDSLNPGRRWGYTVFGQVLSGAEVVDAMATVETEYNMKVGWQNVPVEPVMLIKATILPPPSL
ncbi:MAG: peptidyl-prolyl cis-trans isomerase [Alteromonadaceae bacterium]|nr:peptidyl-prolyl cis-trans isomerase [Alteromonadaceae bacterium]